MAGKAGVDDEIMADINVVPLVDVVLVLLIIFMVTASFIVKPAIELELPKADTGEHRERNQFSLLLGKDGSIVIGKEKIEEELVPAELEKRYEAYKTERLKTLQEEGKSEPSPVQLSLMATENLTMVIQADKLVSHGRVIHFIDLARQVGIMKYAFNVEPPKTATSGSIPANTAGNNEAAK